MVQRQCKTGVSENRGKRCRECDNDRRGKISKVKSDPILDQFADVFAPIGKDALPGKYKIHIDSSVTPTVAAQRQLPAAIRDDVLAELKRMTDNGIIVPVSDPMSWVSSMVIIRKLSGKLRFCIDPLDLNKAIQRPHYQCIANAG